MGITEIVLLILGLGIFTASFLLPEKKKKMQEDDRRFGEEQVKELVNEQMENVKSRVSDVVDETITYAVEKTERAMERLTNEKIMAVNEYSDTVLTEIHKNHEEVVFMYDMLNDKHQNLKDTVAEIEQKVKEAKETAEKSSVPERPEEKASGFLALQPGKVEKKEFGNVLSVPEIPEIPAEKPKRRGGRRKAKPETIEIANAAAGDVNLSFSDEGKNNNEKILALHREGKSNMAIAKELGLGIGEVKLVIDLFRGV